MTDKFKTCFWKNWSGKKKLLLAFSATILFVIVLKAESIAYNIYLITYRWNYRPDVKLAMMISSVIGIPYDQMPQYRNDSTGIKRLTKEEWFALPYYPLSGEKIDLLEDKLNLTEAMPTIEEIKHAGSLSVGQGFAFVNLPPKAIYKKLCKSIFTCDAIKIVVQDYVLKKPEILDSIIKIAKRPCDYIRTLNEVKSGDEIIFAHNFGFRGHKFIRDKFDLTDIQEGIDAANNIFSCDKKSFWQGGGIKALPIFKRQFVIISINESGLVGSAEDKSLDIVITREDI